ncbi:MAG: dockerin type I repeat-containing protein, partial [Candidatus Zixiibacteriota bacterium]
VENVDVVNVLGLGTPFVEGEVEYDVTDHCQPGGSIHITAWDNFGQGGVCGFDVLLSDSPPEFSLCDTWRALAGYTMIIEVTAVDPDGYIMGDIELEGFWYGPDSLQSPTNSPSWDSGNPGFFTWAPTEADTGNWICSFSAADVCGDVTTHLLSIQVGMPFCGDCNGDGEINLGDVVCLIGYLYKQGTPPEPLCKGDASGNGSIDVGDVVLLINYLFKGSFGPSFDCCP